MDPSHTTAAPVSPHTQAVTTAPLLMKAQPNIGPKASTMAPNGEPPHKRPATLNVCPTVSPDDALTPCNAPEDGTPQPPNAVSAMTRRATSRRSSTAAVAAAKVETPSTVSEPSIAVANRLTPVPGKPRQSPKSTTSKPRPAPLRRSRRKNAGKRRRTSFSDDIAASSSSSPSSSSSKSKGNGPSTRARSSSSSSSTSSTSSSSSSSSSSSRKRSKSKAEPKRNPYRQTIKAIDMSSNMEVPPLTIDPANEIRRPTNAAAPTGRKRASTSTCGRARPVPQQATSSQAGGRRNGRRSSRTVASGTASTRATTQVTGKARSKAKPKGKAATSTRRRLKARGAAEEEKEQEETEEEQEQEIEEEDEGELDASADEDESESESERRDIHATFGTIKLKLTHEERFYNAPKEFVNAVLHAFADHDHFDEVFYQDLFSLTSRIPFPPRDFDVVGGDESPPKRPYMPPYPTAPPSVVAPPDTITPDTAKKPTMLAAVPAAAHASTPGGSTEQATPSPPAASSSFRLPSMQGGQPASHATNGGADRALFRLNDTRSCNPQRDVTQAPQATAVPSSSATTTTVAEASATPTTTSLAEFTMNAMSRGTDIEFPRAAPKPLNNYCRTCDAKIASPQECMHCAVQGCTVENLEQGPWRHDLSRTNPTFRFKYELIARIQHLEKLLRAAKPPPKADAYAQAGAVTCEQEQQTAMPPAVTAAATQTDAPPCTHGRNRSPADASRSSDDDGDGDGDGNTGAPRPAAGRGGRSGDGGPDDNNNNGSDAGEEEEHSNAGWTYPEQAAHAEHDHEGMDGGKLGFPCDFDDDDDGSPVRRSRRSRHPSKALLETLWTDDVLKLGKKA